MSAPGTSTRAARGANRRRMFARMIWRGALVRRGRALTALAAVAVAAAVATALFTLYIDAQVTLRSEFRRYGANVVVVEREGTSLPGDAAAQIASAAPGSTALPLAFVVARVDSGAPVVVVGTDLQRARQLNATWWSLTPAPSGSAGATAVPAIIGTRAAAALAADHSFAVSFAQKAISILPTEVLKTGGPEDSRIYIDLPAFREWTAVPVTTYEVAVPGSTAEIEAAVARLAQALPQADVRPVRQIVDAQAQVLGKTRAALLGSTLLVVITAALCMLATLVTWVLDRRRDFAVMKALGASEGLLRGFFAAGELKD